MSSDAVITLEGAGKAYSLFSRPEDRLKQMLLGRFRTYYREFWALKPTDLQIRAGETWGIVGRNGSGKSTMLQMICGNLSPTAGRITVRGRIAALLELGAGFNPDFSGRENVYINGALAGFDRAQVDDRLDRILTFADIGVFIDQPVKTYSSGMFARLAFAVAINIDPDILVVDEALAVGDEAFQRKCFARMEQIKDTGATILFVSHSSQAVTQFCDHALLLHQGESIFIGRPKATVSFYQKLAAAPETAIPGLLHEIRAAKTTPTEPPLQSRTSANTVGLDAPGHELHSEDDDVPESGEQGNHRFIATWDPNIHSTSVVQFAQNGAEIQEALITTLNGDKVNNLVANVKYRLTYRVRFISPARFVKFHFSIRTPSGIALGGGTLPPNIRSIRRVNEGEVLTIHFDFCCALTPSMYFVNCGVTGNGEVLHRILDVLSFRVQADNSRHATGHVDFDVAAWIADRPAETGHSDRPDDNGGARMVDAGSGLT